MFLLIWLIVGVIVSTILITSGMKVSHIANTFLRRLALIAVVASSYFAFVALSAMDHFMQFLDPDDFDISAKDAFMSFLRDIGPQFYGELKGTW